jgi:hypothetical protein
MVGGRRLRALKIAPPDIERLCRRVRQEFPEDEMLFELHVACGTGGFLLAAPDDIACRHQSRRERPRRCGGSG